MLCVESEQDTLKPRTFYCVWLYVIKICCLLILFYANYFITLILFLRLYGKTYVYSCQLILHRVLIH